MAKIWCRAKLKLICFLSILSITSLLVFPTLYSIRLYSKIMHMIYFCNIEEIAQATRKKRAISFSKI